MKNQHSNENEQFKPPKLPIGWLASTFIAPLLILLIPNLIKSLQYDFKWILIIALSVWGALLFVACIALILGLYDTSFLLQLCKNDIRQLSHEQDNIIAQLFNISEELKKQNNYINANLKSIENELSVPHDFTNK